MDDRYQVGQLIDENSYGKFYEAEDTLIQRKVQIFRYNTPSPDDEEKWQETFNSLSAELATVSHPGLPIIYTHGIDDDGPYTIRQLLDSNSLNSRLADAGPLTEFESWELAHQMLEIHDAAKASGIFHQALDPDYIGQVTRPSGKKLYCISNYGLADISNKMSESDAYLGAAYLISPEQSNGEANSEISQIYAIGQLLFHAMSGGHPWIEESLESVKEKQKNEPLGLITEYNTAIPAAMAEWTQKLLAVDPKERFQTYEEATAALPEPISSAPVPILTSPVRSVPATHTTTTQTVITTTSGQVVMPAQVDTSGQPLSAAEAFATQQAAAKAHSGGKIPFFKNPAILGGAGALILAIILISVFSGGDDSKNSNGSGSADGELAEIAKLSRDELVGYFDFNNENLHAYGNESLTLRPLQAAAKFARDGRNGKGLVIDADHFYRLSVRGTDLAIGHKDMSLAFWMKTNRTKNQMVAVESEKAWEDSGDQVWSPEDAVIGGRVWNLVTITFSKVDETATIYLDGQEIATSSNSEIAKLHKQPFLYIGCNSEQEALHKSPITIDGLAIWSKKLDINEIRALLD